MINLIGTSPKTVIEKVGELDYAMHCGFLAQPRNGNHPIKAVNVGAKWAMDNDAFNDFHAERFLTRLLEYQTPPDDYNGDNWLSSCLFVVAPDVVCNASLTLLHFRYWQPVITALGYPVAFVLQNGMESRRVPYDYCDCVFIGGDNTFKYSRYVAHEVKKAKQLNKWVHMGRVNSLERIQYSKSIGCDSFDGTGYARFPRKIDEHFGMWSTVTPQPITLPMF